MKIEVLTYNILNGGEDRKNDILKVIKSTRANIVVLQEVYRAEFLNDLAQSLNMKPYFGNGNRRRRVALLTNLPIRSVRSHRPIFPIWRNVIETKIEITKGNCLFVFGIHPKADLGVVCEIWRWLEAKHILKRVSKHVDKYCLIAGDFNAIAPNDSVIINTMPKLLRLKLWLQGNRPYYFSIQEYLKQGFIDCYRYINGNKNGYTIPTKSPNARIDYILMNNAVKPAIRTCDVVNEHETVVTASDHYPLAAEFEF